MKRVYSEDLLETETSADFTLVNTMEENMKKSISKMIGRDIPKDEWYNLEIKLSNRWNGYLDWINK